VRKLTPVITCEHAGNTIPEPYAHLFETAYDEIQSHLGWDPGAREIGAFLAQHLEAPFYKCEATRLLVEPNRSLHSESLFSKFVQSLNPAERDEVLNQFYFPYRSAVEDWVLASDRPIVHISVHTFTPVFRNVVRDVDVGLLFDPARTAEAGFCASWLNELKQIAPGLRVRFNEPYKGTDDGFTTYLRTKFPDQEYLGIEIEVSQRFVSTPELGAVMTGLLESLQRTLSGGR
jgi:predicted N-formylglutamate amidohydrolase